MAECVVTVPQGQPWQTPWLPAVNRSGALAGRGVRVWGRVVDWTGCCAPVIAWKCTDPPVDPKTARRQRFCARVPAPRACFPGKDLGARRLLTAAPQISALAVGVNDALNAFDLGIASGLIKEDVHLAHWCVSWGCQTPGRPWPAAHACSCLHGRQPVWPPGLSFGQLLRLRLGLFFSSSLSCHLVTGALAGLAVAGGCAYWLFGRVCWCGRAAGTKRAA